MKLNPEIRFTDNQGRQRTIRAPGLVTLLQSEKLQKAYEKDPNRRYSVKDLLDMMPQKLKVDPNTMRNYFRIHIELFGSPEKRIETPKTGLVVVNVRKLQPIVENIFNAIKGDNE